MRLTRRQPQWILSSSIFLASTVLAIASPDAAKAGKERVSRLPIGAQGAISATLGRDDRSYHAARSADGLRASNGRHDLRIEFLREGVTVALDEERAAWSLRALGYGSALAPVAPAAPRPAANRVEYRRGTLTEWYSNGPLGLEQGFTLKSRPVRRAHGPLTLSLSFSGSLDASLEAGDRSLVLSSRGRPVLGYRGLTATDAAGRDLPARLELAHGSVLLRIDDANARYPIVIDPFVQKATLKASDGTPDDGFGLPVAISGGTIVVGAKDAAVGGVEPFAGAAYVFVKPPGGWAGTVAEAAKLIPSDSFSNMMFGFTVSVSGDTAVVGTWLEDTAYVYVKPAAGWAGTLTESARLTPSTANASGDQVHSVAIDGDTVVYGETTAGSVQQGSAWIFLKPSGGWAGNIADSAHLTPSVGASEDEFGFSVAVSGNTAVVSAPFADPSSAYVFVEPPGGWAGTLQESAKLTASDDEPGDHLGYAVAISGDTVVAGAPGDDLPASIGPDQGSAYVFVKPAGGWTGPATESAKLTASDANSSDGFGQSIAIDGDTIVGGPVGVYVFVRPAGGWAGALNETELFKPMLAFGIGISAKTVVAGNNGNAVVLEDLCYGHSLCVDLDVTKSDSPDPVKAKSLLTYTIIVTNHGPSDATEVTMQDVLPKNVKLVNLEFDASQVVCSVNKAQDSIRCGPLPEPQRPLASGDSFRVTIRVKPQKPAKGRENVNTAHVTANEFDPIPANNVAAEATVVQ